LSSTASAILDSLRAVEQERAARRADAALAETSQAVKALQHARFSTAYGDVLALPRWSAAARFFLDDLYGPGDFTRRDAEFARVVPNLVRLFPDNIVQTVRALAELHALSEHMDTAMGRAHVQGGAALQVDGASYGRAWRQVGEAATRQRQIDLMLEVGRALDRYTRNPLLRHSLRLMRGPAQLAGLGELQSFLENGFDTFGAMRGASPFLELIALRETALAERLFAGGGLDEVVRDLPGRLA
jgi:hypothetical protein